MYSGVTHGGSARHYPMYVQVQRAPRRAVPGLAPAFRWRMTRIGSLCVLCGVQLSSVGKELAAVAWTDLLDMEQARARYRAARDQQQ